jgi:hypothetical protein
MKTALGAFAALLLAGIVYIQPAMPRCRYSPGRDFPFRSGREHLHRRNRRERDGASVKGFTAEDGKTGTEKGGARENANAVVGSPTRWSGTSALTGCDNSLDD